MTQTEYNSSDNSVKAADLYFSNLRSENWQTYNVEVAKCTSHTFSILLAVLANKQEYYTRNKKLVSHPKHGDGWFYLEVDPVYEMTGLTRYEQEGAVKIGVRLGIIKCERIGMPGRRHFKVDKQALYNHIVKNRSTTSGKNPELDREETQSMESCEPVGGETPMQFAEKPRTAQYTNPIHYPREVCCANAPGILRKPGIDGKEVRIDESEIMRSMMVDKIDFKSEHFREAWNILANYTKPIHDPYLFITQVLENIQIKEKSQNIKKSQGKKCNSQKASKSTWTEKPQSGSSQTSEKTTEKPIWATFAEIQKTLKEPLPGFETLVTS